MFRFKYVGWGYVVMLIIKCMGYRPRKILRKQKKSGRERKREGERKGERERGRKRDCITDGVYSTPFPTFISVHLTILLL